jgi:hypothetical protein
MIAIFGDLRQFSEIKLAFFSSTNVLVNFLQKKTISCLIKKTTNMFAFFGENIYKIITLVPRTVGTPPPPKLATGNN